MSGFEWLMVALGVLIGCIAFVGIGYAALVLAKSVRERR